MGLSPPAAAGRRRALDSLAAVESRGLHEFDGAFRRTDASARRVGSLITRVAGDPNEMGVPQDAHRYSQVWGCGDNPPASGP